MLKPMMFSQSHLTVPFRSEGATRSIPPSCLKHSLRVLGHQSPDFSPTCLNTVSQSHLLGVFPECSFASQASTLGLLLTPRLRILSTLPGSPSRPQPSGAEVCKVNCDSSRFSPYFRPVVPSPSKPAKPERNHGLPCSPFPLTSLLTLTPYSISHPALIVQALNICEVTSSLTPFSKPACRGHRVGT